MQMLMCCTEIIDIKAMKEGMIPIIITRILSFDCRTSIKERVISLVLCTSVPLKQMRIFAEGQWKCYECAVRWGIIQGAAILKNLIRRRKYSEVKSYVVLQIYKNDN